jgi:hypothetical protein
MATRLSQRISRLQLRKSDAVSGIKVRNTLMKTEQFDKSSDALEYISESMSAVDAKYTQDTFAECNRIEKHIESACESKSVGVTLRHQGSVTTDTHIKFYSDIDLLVITNRFHDLQSPLEPTSPYKGDAMADLKEIRSIVEGRLETSFPEAKVDKSGTKAVAISGGSLKRKIDVISASWLETSEYRRTGVEADKGIKILDLDGPRRIANFPFLHNKELNNKDISTAGRLKKLIRFVKSVRYDADAKIKVSSYDIAALCYHLPLDKFQGTRTEVQLAEEFLVFSEKVRADTSLQGSLFVPNKTRLIFCDDGVKVAELKLLNEEMYDIIKQAKGM